MAHGPYCRIASRCALVPYPLCTAKPYCGYSASSARIRRSRLTFARIEAAAMDALFPSPPMMQRVGIVKPRAQFPSISAKSGVAPRAKSARCIASIVAFRILSASISLSSALAIPKAAAFSRVGSIAALSRGKWFDNAMMVVATCGIAVPSFVVCTVLVYVFGVQLNALPTFGLTSPLHYIMPVASLALYPTAYISRLMRSSMLDVLGQDYMRTAKAKGLSTLKMLFKHALRNAILPVVTYLGPLLAYTVTAVKKLCLLMLVVFALTFSAAALDDPAPQCKAALVIDMNTETTLLDFHADERVYPASTTKIMTALLALEYGKLDEVATVSENAVKSLEGTGSVVSLKAGETFTLDELLHILLIPSSNDASNVIAEHIAGSTDAFVEKMNARAAALGCENTHFMNPHGLHDEEHYTTAADLYKITRAALEYDKFREIVALKEYRVEPTPLTEDVRHYYTTNYLLTQRIDPRRATKPCLKNARTHRRTEDCRAGVAFTP